MHQRLKSGIVALFVTLLFLAASVQADTVKNFPNIKNFGQISETFYRGAQPEGKDYADLASFGVKTVINLTSHDADENEKSMVEAAGMKYIQIPMTTRKVPTDAQLKQFLEIADDKIQQPVYVHCVGGKHRTGVMTAVYRMLQGWTADQAYEEMKKYKFGASFLHPEFKKFVYDYYDQVARTQPVPVIPDTMDTAANTAGQ